METESRLVTRREYSRHIGMFVKTLGITGLRYYKRFMRLTSGYLEVSDGPCETARLNMVDVLMQFITETWPRMPAHTPEMLKMLLRLVYDVATDPSLTPADVKEALTDKAVSCMILVKRADYDKVQLTLSSLLDADIHPSVKHSINRVLESS